ncbi:TPA: hypothetical protein DCZ46_00215 [Candidatus Campbellbacteria bacterium]|uniref:PDZ domain-containing protein n=2 Tax=Candidatus Campbelliibacteriota TaxID=1752727 RepID=A0A1F5EQ21_9BACT|nr:MAG: membrane-associated zinc metalloprotease [Candidatus Campbellbacteria bacterium GW2011_OD1_34_28]KKP74605.1 MAG: Membrane-associated zinc metalloprotease [Candidatus Campbellbacteria bacterium GW2011_GWD2_35_24]KKP76737.1 MAG: Membrane-associated zinc metalloprotease [Candidatus Campbellbacteria bacterium GW2011_GWC1_35_31]KKP78692.1 MAG: Membrane-associated zinc metalloprotease [Candidatus Campbellbacteria bacterium GW2011_GWD1_35_49]OGD68025.1 MAG: hypothetical protein A2811_02980 [Ca
MTIILFIIVLAVLILVHEFGHFITAKKLGMRVDEFGIGFPPRIFAIKKGETEYSINSVPLGGFVKIFGEDPDDTSINGPDKGRSLINKPKWAQAIVISAGVISNVIFAWFLIAIGFMIGLPVSVDQPGFEDALDQKVVIVDVKKDSPAMNADLQIGDKLVSLSTESETIKDFGEDKMRDFISVHGGEEIEIVIERGKNNTVTTSAIPIAGILEGGYAIGIATDVVGIAKLSFFDALWESAKLTKDLLIAIVESFAGFITSLFDGTGNFSNLAGPIGIVGMVGDASQFGWVYLLNFVAFISINLAIINSIPFPALDGGRLLFIVIESIVRKNIKPIVTNTLNTIGFVLLIVLMIAVTYNDILKLF